MKLTYRNLNSMEKHLEPEHHIGLKFFLKKNSNFCFKEICLEQFHCKNIKIMEN